MVTGVGLVPYWWIWWLQGITRLDVSATVELAAGGLRLGSRDNKCVIIIIK